MDELVLHPSTRQQIEAYALKPAHAVLLTAPAGSGKLTLAKQLATMLLNVKPAKLEGYSYFLQVVPDKQVITIEVIRHLQHFLQNKTIGSDKIRRIVIIEDSQVMTKEAQNALLKSLEEPPEDTVIILTATNKNQLLPTIISRLQTIVIHRPSDEDLRKYFSHKAGFDQAYYLSHGLPGLLASLLNNDQLQPLVKNIELAKQVLRSSYFDRLLIADGIKQADVALQLVEALETIAQAGLERSINQVRQLPRWQSILKATFNAKQALTCNANLKLVLTELMLAI